MPGSWFGGTDAGSLTATERREQYKAQAVEFAAVHDFPAGRGGGKRTKESAIRFICIEDAADDPHSKGYWMKLLQWNRLQCNRGTVQHCTFAVFLVIAALSAQCNLRAVHSVHSAVTVL